MAGFVFQAEGQSPAPPRFVVVVDESAGRDAAAVDAATRAVRAARGADGELRITRTPTEQLSVTSYFAARGYDIVGVGLDREIAVDPVAEPTPTRASPSPTPAGSPPPSPPPRADPARGGRGVASRPMEHRTLGRTGMYVSPLCLGAMMFGDWGNKDHDESIRIIHRALDAGINFIDTADVYSRGESEEIVGKALKGRRDDVDPRHQGPRHDGRRPEPVRQLAPLDREGVRRQPEAAAAPTGSTSTRSTAPSTTPTSTRRSAR